MPSKNKKVWFNIRRVIGGTTLTEYHSYSTDLKCRNLCVTTPPPNRMAKLLGLGTNFCIQFKSLNHKNFKSMIEHFKNDVRVRHYVSNVLGDQQQDLLKLYIKIFNPNTPKATTPIEGALKRFEAALTRSFNNRK